MSDTMSLIEQAQEYLSRARNGLQTALPEGREHARVMLVEADRKIIAALSYHLDDEEEDAEEEGETP